MEYCAGGDLHDALVAREGVPLDEQQALAWFGQAALAVDYMHAKRILHRDLKTKNMFLSADQQTLKLGDFGISRVLANTLEHAETIVGLEHM